MRLPGKWVLSLGLMAAAPGAAFAGPLDFLKPQAGGEAGAAGAPQSNQQVAEAVKVALERARLTSKDFAIEVKGGVCTLEGQILDAQQRMAAAKIAGSVPGVQRVDNRLVPMATAGAPRSMPSTSGVQQAGFDNNGSQGVRQVSNEVAQPLTGAPASNEQVAREIAGALAGAGLQGYDIEVRYKGGVAALVGDVGSAQEAQIAEQAARGVGGVNRVLNNLTVAGAPAAAPQGQYGGPQFGGPQMGGPQMGGPQMGGYGTPAIPTGYQLPAGYPQAYPPGPAPGPVPGGPVPTAGHLIHNAPNVPEHAWPAYAPYDNYAQVTYPSAYDASAWPYIGPFYPYPQVPMEWRSAQLEWDDGHWQLKFHSRTDKWWWFMDPHNWH